MLLVRAVNLAVKLGSIADRLSFSGKHRVLQLTWREREASGRVVITPQIRRVWERKRDCDMMRR